jgi:lipoprotein-releasing system ATP-binding protein
MLDVKPLLIAKSLTKTYGALQALKGVSLEIARGEVVSIVGPSGAGKTTLLQILGTLESPDTGEMILDGENPFTLNPVALAKFRNQKIGFVFQFHNLLPEFTALENVCLPGMLAGHKKNSIEPRAKELLDLLGLSGRINHGGAQLSGGEQQRVAVARALLNEPALILADEPSGNLDSENAAVLHDIFFTLRKELGQTFVIVTHNPILANRCDRVIRLQDGRDASASA